MQFPDLIPEIIDQIIFHAEVHVFVLCQVCQYFAQHTKRIKIHTISWYLDNSDYNIVKYKPYCAVPDFLPSLTTLKISDNYGSIDNIKNLTQLKKFCAYVQYEIGDEIIRHLTNLDTLMFGRNQISFDVLATLPHLTNLSTDGGLSGVYLLTNLTKLSINDIKSNEISLLTNLLHLNLSWCVDIDHNTFIHLTKLTNLYLEYTNCENDHISHLTNLKQISTFENDNINYELLQHMINLQEFDLNHNNDLLNEHIWNLTNLTELQICVGDNISEECLRRLTKLSSLDIIGNNTAVNRDDKGYININISFLTNLRYLSIDYTNVDDNQLINLTNLTILSMTDANVNKFSHLTNLTELFIKDELSNDYNEISHLVKLRSLTVIYNNSLIIETIRKLTNLTYLRIPQKWLEFNHINKS